MGKKYTLKIQQLILMSIIMSFIVGLLSQSNLMTVQAATTYLKQQTLTTLPPVKHIQITRGHNHDRQYPGVWLKAGQVIKARQINPLFKDKISFELLADDSPKEVATSILPGGAFATLTAKADSVPFVRTPIVNPGTPQPIIEYEIDTASEEVPLYVEGGDEQAFKAKWAATNAPFAVFDSTRMQLLIPIVDRDRFYTTFNGNLLQLAQFYTYVLEQYDRFAGLEDNPANPIDANVRAKYFMKANAHGAGWAYYSVNFVAQNALKMSDLVFPGHGLYHEIGHGYDIKGDNIDLGEMWNNIYSHYLETNSPYKVPAWLYLGVTQDTNENEPYGSFRSRLQFFIDLFDFIGPEKAMADFNKAYRRAMASGGIKMPMTEFMIRTFSESSGYNIASYFENKGFTVPQELKRWEFEKAYPNITPIQPLYGISTQAGTIPKAEAARQTLSLANRYNLTPTATTTALNTNASLTVQLTAPDMAVLQGREVVVYDGAQEIARVQVSGSTVVFNNLPIGEYTVRLPQMSTGLYQYNEFNYVTVTEKGATLDGNYKILDDTLYRNDVNIDMAGLGGAPFASIDYKKATQTLDINKLKVSPHAYFTTTYASYKVYDAANNLIDSADFNGKDSTGFQRTVPFTEGYRIEIFHAEPGRLSIKTAISNQDLYVQAAKVQTASYTLRDGLLVLDGETRTNVDILQDLLRNYLNNLITQYGVDEAKVRIYHSVHANIIASTLNEMSIADQQEIFNEYTNLFQPIGIQVPTPLTASLGASQSQFKTALDPQIVKTGNGETVLTDDWSNVPVTATSTFSTPGNFPIQYSMTDFFMFKALATAFLTINQDSQVPVISGVLPTVDLFTGDIFDPKVGVSALDDVDGDITSLINIAGSVDTTKAGTYVLTYTVTDKAGNTATLTQTVTVKDKMAQIKIVKKDKQSQAFLSGAEFVIKDAAGNIVDRVVTGTNGEIVSKSLLLGVYMVEETIAPVNYEQDTTIHTVILDVNGSTTPIELFNTLKDIQKPALNVGTSNVTLTVGDPFDPKAGITAIDNIDGDLTSAVVVTGSVDTTKAGTYTLTYTVTDKAGNVTTLSRTVVVKAKPVVPVVDTEKPVLSGIATQATELTVGDPFDPKAGITAIDNIDGDLTSAVVVTGNVDTTKAGTYTLTYTVTDKSGNVATLSRTIVVKERAKDVLMAQIKVTQRDEQTKAPLAGVAFDVKDASGNIVDRIVTGANGEALSKQLPLGVYTLVEVATPQGYVKGIAARTITLTKDKEVVAVTQDSKKDTITPTSTPIKGKIIVSKFDKETKTRLSGMVFKIKHLGTGQERIVEMNQYNVMELLELGAGTYEITEITAPKGYEVDSTVYKIQIEKDGDVKQLDIYDMRKAETPKPAAEVAENKGVTALPDTGVKQTQVPVGIFFLIGVVIIGLFIAIIFRKRTIN